MSKVEEKNKSIMKCINCENIIDFGNPKEPIHFEDLCSKCFHEISTCQECSIEQSRKCNNNFKNCIKVKEFIKNQKRKQRSMF
ncbi:MAG: hypothetical protein ACFFG0_18125 [Candidatus Thorarchaeota archaeon]